MSIECYGGGSGVQECNESFNFGMGDRKWKEYVWFEISELIEVSDKRIVFVLHVILCYQLCQWFDCE